MAASFCTMSGGDDDEITDSKRSFSELAESELARLCTSCMKLQERRIVHRKLYCINMRIARQHSRL